MTARGKRLVRVCQHRRHRAELKLNEVLQEEQRRRRCCDEAQQAVEQAEQAIEAVQDATNVAAPCELHSLRAAQDYLQSLDARLECAQRCLQERTAELLAAAQARHAAGQILRIATVKLEHSLQEEKSEHRRAQIREDQRREEQSQESWGVATAFKAMPLGT